MDASDTLSESLSSPPPYRRNPSPSLLLAETRTTRTEVVTTTTTTHTFSLPYWRKRNTTKLPTSQHEVQPTSLPKSRTPTLLIDKALPPTPPLDSEVPNPQRPVVHSELESVQHEGPQAHRKSTTVPQSTIALAHAALGIGLPHASASFSRSEANTIPFMSPYSSRPPSGSSPRPSTSPGLRRSKSSHRVQSRDISENHEHVDDSRESQVLERRRRGLSFGATSLLNVNHNSDAKGKGKTPDSPSLLSESPKSSAKSLTRKSSFWNRKKATQATESSVESTPVLSDSVVLLPPLPPVLHVSPFNISSFSDVSQSVNTANATRAMQLSRSQSEGSQALESIMISTSEPQMLCSTPPIPWTNSPQDSPSTSKIMLSGEAPPAYRPRRQASTPLLHRLSMGVFSSGESSPSSSIPPNNNSHFSFRSPSHHPSPHKIDNPIPKPLFGQEEAPEVYLTRLKAAVSKAEVAGILASRYVSWIFYISNRLNFAFFYSVDPFYASALQAYINQFDFCDVPLDIALRKLLMEVGLPRETQQIDRVMEAFAARYMQCNANTFTSEGRLNSLERE